MRMEELSGAIFSEDRRYRYLLWRELGQGSGTICVCGLNPSTADELVNDPTISRCIERAKAYGFRRLEMLNLFGWRDTVSKNLLKVADPVGPGNDGAIVAAAARADLFLCAWGSASPLIPARAKRVLELLKGRPLHALQVNKSGQPSHPLYLSYQLRPERWLP